DGAEPEGQLGLPRGRAQVPERLATGGVEVVEGAALGEQRELALVEAGAAREVVHRRKRPPPRGALDGLAVSLAEALHVAQAHADGVGRGAFVALEARLEAAVPRR